MTPFIYSVRNDFDSTVFLFVNITSIRPDTSRRLDETHAYRFHLLCMTNRTRIRLHVGYSKFHP